MATIGNRIKELRNEAGLTQAEFGKLFGIVKSTVSMYEKGKSVPDDNIKKKMANHFGVSLDYLMGKSNMRNAEDKITSALTDDPELLEFWDELKERPELQLLFKQTRSLSENDIMRIIRVIKAIEDQEDEIYG